MQLSLMLLFLHSAPNNLDVKEAIAAEDRNKKTVKNCGNGKGL